MPRTTAQKVRDTLQGEYDTERNPPLDEFITRGGLLVDWLETNDSDSVLSSAVLIQLETLLAAHYYQSSDPGYQSRGTGGASGSFLGQTGLGFKKTRYGQDAMELDFTGMLSKRQKEIEQGGSVKPKMLWLGTDDPDATN